VAELSKAIAQLMAARERGQPLLGPSTDPKLHELRHIVRNRVAPGERAFADAFVVHLFDKAGANICAAGQVAQLSAAVLSVFRFVLEPTLDEPRVAVFDPDLIQDGRETPGTVVDTCMRDRPFIVDTIRECLQDSGCTIRRLLHPIFSIQRDLRGAVLAVAPPGGLGRQESVVYVELDRVPDYDALATLLTQRLTDVIHATDDYPAMRAKAQDAAESLRTRQWPQPWNIDSEEIAVFLEWLGQKNFVFLGYREYQFAGQGAERTAEVRHGSGLGILRDESRSTYATVRPLPETLRRRLNEPPLLTVSKTNAESPIHRRAHMDYIGVKEVDNVGVVVGERRFLGLFTSKAYADEPTVMPLLRRRLAAVLEVEGAVEESHDYRAIVATFNSIPKVELLAASVSELHAEIRTILEAASGPRARDVRLLQRLDALGRGVFVVVIVPRERFSDELYRSAEVHLATALSASTVLEQRLVIDDESDRVRMHFYFATSAAGITVTTEELQAGVASLLRTWDDRLRDALRERGPRDRARLLAERYLAVFSTQYKAATDVAVAVRDIECLETLAATRSVQVALTNDSGDTRCSALKLYLADEELVLSDFLPVLENLGLKVFAEYPLAIAMPEVGRVRIHTFLVQDQTGMRLDEAGVAPRLTAALAMLHAGRVDNDRLNTLIVSAQLDWRQVDLLRTYVNHGAQIGTAASRAAIVHALVSYPQSARLLWQYFDEKFDCAKPATQRERLTRILPEIEPLWVASLDAVQSVAHDRILRALFSAVAATVRTNFYAPAANEAWRSGGEGGAGDRAARGRLERPALALKIDCARIPHLPRPYPLYEIYVHAPHVEGLHLRGGRVARGGIRLSDRPDDFRTEIHDLMRTQTVKNAVIIPAGAKGGFIAKRRPGDALTPAAVVAAYRTFINALLDLTDNVVRGRVVQPAAVLAYDDADPYLVVAADKGTATFSDIANELAAQHQFWLGDAFASGGTHGYDHKKEGITARGAWECVRRHFREMGRDADRDAITVIGIGDMSGDVFGNGMLLSQSFRLRAAVNHQHIFLDPDPDPVRACAERERLFRLPRSSWSDYSASAISPGGGVYLRNAKTVPLSQAARTMLGLSETPSGEEIVHAILCMEADLLWNGGIGTYVKASDETHAEVGDSANDTVRVNGADLRVKVAAEGGNLGCTQRGRIEYALRGGRINTDAIDNSAGVDMSDHEVNLKIALAAALESGQVSFDDRNQLLTDVAPDITRRVLEHNRSQARALSLDQLRSQTRLADFRELMAQLEADGWLDRRFENLPDREALRNRRGQLLGLTRPELAVLLAHSKLALQRQLLASRLPDDPYYEPYLRCYFPDVIDRRFGQGVRSHRLRREIISVEIANVLIDTMGAAFVTRVSRDTGAAAVSVVRAWTVAMAVSGADELWDVIRGAAPRGAAPSDTVASDAAAPLSPATEAACWFALEAAVERATKWIVETQPQEEPVAGLNDMLAASTRERLQLLPEVLPAPAREQLDATVEALAAKGAPRALAARIVSLDQLADLFEVAHIARDRDVSRDLTAEVYYRLGEVVDLDWVQRCLRELPAEDRWERRALEGLNEGLMYARRQLVYNILQYSTAGGAVDACLREYVAGHQAQLTALAALVSDIKSAPHASLAAVLVVMRELGRLVGTRA
jgi:glutamate dehydrogenase